MKQKTCKTCNTKFEPIKPIQPRCFDCTIQYAKEQVKKATEKRKKAEIAKIKESAKDAKYYREKLQTEINRLVRMIDKGQPCISSGRKWKETDQAGHYDSVGSHPEYRFNLWNIHSQSVSDNKYKHGNRAGYTTGIANRYGMVLISKCRKLSMDDLKESLARTKEAQRWLIAQGYEYPLSIELLKETRNYLNEFIGLH